MADTVDSDTARHHIKRMPVVQATGDSESAATELTRDVRPRRIVDVDATERRRREGAACSSIISTSRASETRGPAGTRRQTIEAQTKNGRAIADESFQREDRQAVWYRVPGDKPTGSARLRPSSRRVGVCAMTLFNVGGMTEYRVDGR